MPLDAAAAELARVRPLADGLGADIQAEFRDAENAVAAQRAAANADPLALWQPAAGRDDHPVRGDGRADTSAADRLREQVAALTPRIAELDRLRRQARHRIDDLAAAAAAARAARQDAVAARRDAAARISALPALPPEVSEPPLAEPRRAGRRRPVEQAGGGA